MRKVIAAVAALAVLAVPVTASAATPAPTRAQFNALKSQVSNLQKRVGEAESNIGVLSYLALYNECDDAFQWDWLDQIVLAMGQDPGAPYDDQGACAAVGIDRSKVAARSTAGVGTVEVDGLTLTVKPSSDHRQAMVRGLVARLAG